MIKLYNSIVNPNLTIRRINITACNLENETNESKIRKQYDLFSDIAYEDQKEKLELEQEKQERNIQKAILNIKNKYGKNSILKAMNLEDGATTIDRNKQVGGHKG